MERRRRRLWSCKQASRHATDSRKAGPPHATEPSPAPKIPPPSTSSVWAVDSRPALPSWLESPAAPLAFSSLLSCALVPAPRSLPSRPFSLQHPFDVVCLPSCRPDRLPIVILARSPTGALTAASNCLELRVLQHRSVFPVPCHRRRLLYTSFATPKHPASTSFQRVKTHPPLYILKMGLFDKLQASMYTQRGWRTRQPILQDRLTNTANRTRALPP